MSFTKRSNRQRASELRYHGAHTRRNKFNRTINKTRKSVVIEGNSTFAKPGSLLDPFMGTPLPSNIRKLYGGANEVIGEGGYGCVLRAASLPCLGTKMKNIKNKVSKILTSDAALSELKNHSYVYDNFDKPMSLKKHFIMKPPDMCDPNLSKMEAVSKCDSGEEIRENVRDYKILVMENGGLSLSDLYKKQVTGNWSRVEKIVFLKSFQNIFDGLVKMSDGRYLHHDIKPQNILYDVKKKRLSLIDFGLARHVSDLITKLDTVPFSTVKHGKLRPGYHFSYPKEHHLMAKSNFTRFANLLLKNQDQARAKSEVRVFVGSDFDSQQSTYFKYSEDSAVHRREVSVEMDAMLGALKKSITHKRSIEGIYQTLLQKHWQTFDTYALGFTMLYVLQKIFSEESKPGNRDSSLVKELRKLCIKMCTPNLFNRILPKEASDLYRSILEKEL